MHSERHPTTFELEAHHVGEGPSTIAAHVAVCRSCSGYLRGLEDEAVAFRARARPEPFVRELRRRVGGADAQSHRWRFVLLMPVVGALGVVAICLAVFRPMSEFPPGSVDIGDLRARGGHGGPSVAVILWRAGHQSRHVAEVDARAGDRFRVEVAVAQDTELEAVIVDDTGVRTSLGPRQAFVAGSHLFEPTFTFDARPYTARLLVGPPDAVARVLSGQPDERVGAVALRVAAGLPDEPPRPGRESPSP